MPGSLFLQSGLQARSPERLGIPPDALDAALLFLDVTSPLQSARTRPAGGTAYDVNCMHLPARLAQRRIERVVVTAEHHGAVVGE